jgi:hypothetical protein
MGITEKNKMMDDFYVILSHGWELYKNLGVPELSPKGPLFL